MEPMTVCCLLLYIVCFQIVAINSRTSTLWKLNAENGKIVSIVKNAEDVDEVHQPYDNDVIFDIIITSVPVVDGDGLGWSRKARIPSTNKSTSVASTADQIPQPNRPTITPTAQAKPSSSVDTNAVSSDLLSCGKPVNFTFYDDLIGIAQRFSHPNNPEPEVAFLFMKKKEPKYLHQFDVNTLERRLRKARKENPRSVQLFNQIGNFWRIKGDTKQAIECFRKALSITPTNSDVLLNLARVLFHMQYLDDAIHLTRKSLEMQTPDRSAWRQYFTLGEIFKAYGHFQESILHLRHALELHPNHELITKALRDVENLPTTSLHVYTILIIVCLVLSVLLVILSSDSAPITNAANSSSIGAGCNDSSVDQRGQRHFNRAMAMRSLKGFAARSNKYRK